MPVLKHVPARNVTSDVMTQLEEKILSGRLKSGAKLPSEKELAQQAGVGRRAVREALQALQLKGLIVIRKGSGSWVARNDLDHFLESLSRNLRAYITNDAAQLAHVLEVRELIDGGVAEKLVGIPVAGLAARLSHLVDAQERGLRERDPDVYLAAHYEFHLALVGGLGNPLLTMIYEQVLKLIQREMSVRGTEPSVERRSIREHRGIVAAISSGNVGQAKRALHEHLQRSRRTLRTAIGRSP